MSISSINILLLGSGGREDALAWGLRQSPSCGELLAAPGNPGIARWAECLAIDPTDPDKVVTLARERNVGLVVVGPEAPLVAGVADACREAGIPVFGPSAAAAMLEGSKGFTKDLCAAEGIPTARFVRLADTDAAIEALGDFGLPVVIKADGLAAGKGVTVATTREEAEQAIRDLGGAALVIEEFLEGEEASLFALVDGEQALFLAIRAGPQARRRRRCRARTPAAWAPIPPPRADRRAAGSGDGRNRGSDRHGRWCARERLSPGCFMQV